MTRKEKTYYSILCEMSGYPYKADSAQKQLATKCKSFLLNALNEQVSEGEIKDPVFGCSIKPFYGHNLSWNKAKWRESAEIVYAYFKASTVISEIKKYERIFNTTIVLDYKELLEFLVKAFRNGEEIEWCFAPSIGKDFCLVPESSLTDIIKKFTDLFE